MELSNLDQIDTAECIEMLAFPPVADAPALSGQSRRRPPVEWEWLRPRMDMSIFWKV
jgi:hypothetical protein